MKDPVASLVQRPDDSCQIPSMRTSPETFFPLDACSSKAAASPSGEVQAARYVVAQAASDMLI